MQEYYFDYNKEFNEYGINLNRFKIKITTLKEKLNKKVKEILQSKWYVTFANVFIEFSNSDIISVGDFSKYIYIWGDQLW